MHSGAVGTEEAGKGFGSSLDLVVVAAVPVFSIARLSCLLMVSSSIMIEGGEATRIM